MSVERRYCARLPVQFDVIIHYRQRRFPVARAQNLSSEGIYLETANITLPSGTLVNVEMDRWGRDWLVSAVVVHGDGNGVGLMFRTSLPELYRLEAAGQRRPRPPVTDRDPARIGA